MSLRQQQKVGFYREPRREDSASSAAIQAFRCILKPEQIVSDPKVLEHYERATFPSIHSIPMILYPKNTAEVQECVNVARQYRVPLYPISRGSNWGYGSRVPAQEGCAVLDLSFMNQIVEYDEKLGYVRLEPGVTQGQLYEFLQKNGGRYWMDCTAAGPNASVIGNVLERGFGHTPLAERCSSVCAMEVVLGDGTLLRTGYGQFANSVSTHVYRWGLGPSLDGLFCQSSFGIIVGLTLWLLPAPALFKTFVLEIPDDNCLDETIDRLRGIRQAGLLQSAVHFANVFRFLSPRDIPEIQTTYITPQRAHEAARTLKLPAWLGFGGLYGNQSTVPALKKTLLQTLKGARLRAHFLGDSSLKGLGILRRVLSPLSMFGDGTFHSKVRGLESIFELLKGKPTLRPLHGIYLKTQGMPELPDPDRDGCGLYWCSPVLPHDAMHVRRVRDLISTILTSYNFEPGMTFTLLNGRAIDCVASIIYNRNDPVIENMATKCHAQLLDSLIRDGYYPYRLGISQRLPLEKRCAHAHEILNALKCVFDPTGIISPGRYC